MKELDEITKHTNSNNDKGILKTLPPSAAGIISIIISFRFKLICKGKMRRNIMVRKKHLHFKFLVINLLLYLNYLVEPFPKNSPNNKSSKRTHQNDSEIKNTFMV